MLSPITYVCGAFALEPPRVWGTCDTLCLLACQNIYQRPLKVHSLTWQGCVVQHNTMHSQCPILSTTGPGHTTMNLSPSRYNSTHKWQRPPLQTAVKKDACIKRCMHLTGQRVDNSNKAGCQQRHGMEAVQGSKHTTHKMQDVSFAYPVKHHKHTTPEIRFCIGTVI